MPNFLETLNNIKTGAAAIREAIQFSNIDRVGANTDLSQGLSRRERAVRLRNDPRWKMAVAECGNLFADVYAGRRPDWHLKEAMTSADFPNIFGDLLYRQLLGNYTPYPVTYPNYMRIAELNNFRKLHMYALDGGQGALTVPMKEREPYKEVAFVESPYSVSVSKYGRRYGISMEMVINDDLNAFQQRPLMMATGARRGEEYLATTMLCDVNGPHAGFFTSGNKNIVTANPALSFAGLQTAYKVLAAQKDKDGEPITITAVRLVVTPNDEIVANNILNAREVRVSEAGGTTNQLAYIQNWMAGRVTISVNPYIPIVASSATANPWFLIAEPNDMTQRPAFVFAFLRGRRQPQLFLKDPDAVPLSGGAPDPLDGDFDHDGIDYKLRHFFGAAQIDPKMAVASNGTGS